VTRSDEKRTAVITGASQGLGFELAKSLAPRGWSLVIDARRGDRLESARKILSGLARTEIVAIPGDITDPSHRRELVGAASTIGHVRLVVNNASTLGASPLPAIDRLDPEVLKTVLDTNVVAPVALISGLAAELGSGATIVNISSDAAVGPYPGWGGYGASKAALDQVSRILAVEHPEWRVLSIDPGDMRTEMHQDAYPGEDITDRPKPATAAVRLARLVEGNEPSGRYELSALDPSTTRKDG
jgi:NAD(P)-dependent dehydrogenase (short-subunit alcohol dehydrogenase family)